MSALDQLKAALLAAFGPQQIAQLLAQLAPRLIVAGVIMGVAHLIWIVARGALARACQRAKLPDDAQAVLQRALRAALLAVATISALGQLGVNTAPLLAALGLGGFTLSIAARDALSNILSGLMLMWERPFAVGDHIEVEGHRGRVSAIQLRATTLADEAGQVIVPNRLIVNATIKRG